MSATEHKNLDGKIINAHASLQILTEEIDRMTITNTAIEIANTIENLGTMNNNNILNIEENFQVNMGLMEEITENIDTTSMVNSAISNINEETTLITNVIIADKIATIKYETDNASQVYKDLTADILKK